VLLLVGGWFLIKSFLAHLKEKDELHKAERAAAEIAHRGERDANQEAHLDALDKAVAPIDKLAARIEAVHEDVRDLRRELSPPPTLRRGG